MGIPPAFVPDGIQDTGSIAATFGFDLDLWGQNRAALATDGFALNLCALLLRLCRPEGILFGNEETPQAMIDLENLLRLSLHDASPRARRLRTWLYQTLLPHLFSSVGLPSYRQLNTADKRLRVLKWHDDWWMSLGDVMQVFGTRPELQGLDGSTERR